MFQDTPQCMFNSELFNASYWYYLKSWLVLFGNIYNRVDHELQSFHIVFSILTNKKCNIEFYIKISWCSGNLFLWIKSTKNLLVFYCLEWCFDPKITSKTIANVRKLFKVLSTTLQMRISIGNRNLNFH